MPSEACLRAAAAIVGSDSFMRIREAVLRARARDIDLLICADPSDLSAIATLQSRIKLYAVFLNVDDMAEFINTGD